MAPKIPQFGGFTFFKGEEAYRLASGATVFVLNGDLELSEGRRFEARQEWEQRFGIVVQPGFYRLNYKGFQLDFLEDEEEPEHSIIGRFNYCYVRV